jgi:hypothetical protein
MKKFIVLLALLMPLQVYCQSDSISECSGVSIGTINIKWSNKKATLEKMFKKNGYYLYSSQENVVRFNNDDDLHYKKFFVIHFFKNKIDGISYYFECQEKTDYNWYCLMKSFETSERAFAENFEIKDKSASNKTEEFRDEYLQKFGCPVKLIFECRPQQHETLIEWIRIIK